MKNLKVGQSVYVPAIKLSGVIQHLWETGGIQLVTIHTGIDIEGAYHNTVVSPDGLTPFDPSNQIVTPDEQPEQVNQPADIPGAVWAAAKQLVINWECPDLPSEGDIRETAETIWSYVKSAAAWGKQ